MVLIVKISADASLPLLEERINETRGDAIPNYLESLAKADEVVETSVLIRHSVKSAGLYAYSISSTSSSTQNIPNVRATTLAMTCGLHSKRFVNDVYIGRLGHTSSGLANVDVSAKDLHLAVYTPDLRESFVDEMIHNGYIPNLSIAAAPDWLCAGAKANYHDDKSITALAVAMTRTDILQDDGSSSTSESESTNESPSKNDDNQVQVAPCQNSQLINFEATLCIHCRRPASTLCNICYGAYFCEEPLKCKIIGWSHQCICKTWKLYVQRRHLLSSFPYFSGWQSLLLQDDCHSSDAAYKQYLMDTLHVVNKEDCSTTAAETTWWSTEIHGWNGGKSKSAKIVDLFKRVSYCDGLGLNTSLIPAERPIVRDEILRAGISFNEYNMPILSSWEEYYRLRSLPPSSPVALLATFPLTVYYAIQRHGIVPVTVAQMLDRPLRIHLVGIEKELNFIDFFREVGFILPSTIQIEMTWIIRDDMFPETSTKSRVNGDQILLSLNLTPNAKLSIIGGTYGDALDPNFDIIGGAPDMVIGLNAGLYAYESWRHVVTYLDSNPNVVGVFTDYNEHSGMNCASLGGAIARQSLRINPFRQPRAMPVNCMNLPQFSNGFIYIFNEQEVDS